LRSDFKRQGGGGRRKRGTGKEQIIAVSIVSTFLFSEEERRKKQKACSINGGKRNSQMGDRGLAGKSNNKRNQKVVIGVDAHRKGLKGVSSGKHGKAARIPYHTDETRGA